MKKQIVFIDWNKTLSNSLFWEQLKDIKHPHHKLYPLIERWLFVDNRQILGLWIRGQVSCYEVINRMSKELGINNNILLDELKYSCQNMSYTLNNIEYYIRRLRDQGMKVAVATDNMDVFSSFTVPAMNLYDVFDAVINSCDIGCLKDDQYPIDKIVFFDNYLSCHGLRYSDAILLDDSLDQSGKYRKLGFDRVLVNNRQALRQALMRLIDGI